jgi:hypothetical protein
MSALAAVSLLGACSPWQTYPNVESSLSIGSAKTEPVPSLMAESIRHSHDKWGNRTYSQTEPVINLPEGTPAEVYVTVTEKLGGGQPMMSPGQPAYHVTQVRVRALDAEVDLMYPAGDGLMREATLYFEKDVWSKFRVTGVRPWRVPVRETPPPHYTPEPVESAPAPDAAPHAAPATPGADAVEQQPAETEAP